jgi:inosine-uridine nucleoside N-ribohydrolase
MHKVIFDTDPGVDDAMALLFLHNHPEIDLIGITTVFGNAAIETTTRNALFLKREWGIAAPVARGEGKTYNPMRNPTDWPVMIHGHDGLGNIDVPEAIDLPVDPRPAHRFIIETVRANPGEVTLIAVGRMSNLAYALKEDPEIAGLVKQVIIMGGAFDVPGNITPAAEANIHGDPEAADAVMTAPWKVVVVGLDVTMKTVMTRRRLAELTAQNGRNLKLLSAVSQFYIDFYGRHVKGEGMVVHDSCACIYLVAPELFETRSGAIRVRRTASSSRRCAPIPAR